VRFGTIKNVSIGEPPVDVTHESVVSHELIDPKLVTVDIAMSMWAENRFSNIIGKAEWIGIASRDSANTRVVVSHSPVKRWSRSTICPSTCYMETSERLSESRRGLKLNRKHLESHKGALHVSERSQVNTIGFTKRLHLIPAGLSGSFRSLGIFTHRSVLSLHLNQGIAARQVVVITRISRYLDCVTSSVGTSLRGYELKNGDKKGNDSNHYQRLSEIRDSNIRTRLQRLRVGLLGLKAQYKFLLVLLAVFSFGSLSCRISSALGITRAPITSGTSDWLCSGISSRK
jgi:hypothetical protein